MTIGTLSANRFINPDVQYCDEDGVPYAGGFLYFYITGTSTPLNTYSDADLNSTHANANPITLDSAGRAGTIWLEALAYKVVLKDASANTIWTMDPVYTADYATFGKFQTYAGNPNGNVAGTAGSGAVPASVCWDRSNNILYVCTTTGIAAAAVWTNVAATFSGAVLFTGVITPTQLVADTNNWAPTSFSTAYHVRANASTAINLTGLAGGAAGREVQISNIGSNNITFLGNNASSTASNQFAFPRPVVLRPSDSLILSYDGTSSLWRIKTPLVAQPPAASFKNLKIQAAADTTLAVTADSLTLETANGEAFRAMTVSLSIAITTSGANGLDTGAEASNTWYAIWCIYNPVTNTTAGLLSVSSTLGTITLPAGYTFGARVGWVRNDNSSNFLRFLQYGRVVQFTVGTTPSVAPIIVSSAGGAAGTYSVTSPTLTTASVTSFAPTTTAFRINLNVYSNYKGANATNVLVAPSTAWGGTNRGPQGSSGQVWPVALTAGAASVNGFGSSIWLMLEATTIAWATDDIGGAIACLGFEDNI